MNFKKSKDVKRSSYYVWFLGSKESKGLRGDEYVTPVLNYLLDGECGGNNGGGGGDAQPLVEPSKVTLQVSSKGLKIIQILTVPRKSCQKLSADQQSALFFAKQQQQQSKGGPPFGDSASAAASSMLKSEQVKHHIPHNSITWVYQEEDVVCAILLLYNPLTRCPVHVHAYRCDSVETADSLRGQLQALVSRPENQKKFRDIESRLRAKGLLLTRSQVNNGQHGINSHSHNSHNNHNSSDRCDNSYNYAEEEELPPLPVAPLGGGGGGPTSKTLKSDGRSTRTEGSDELNSEESNSSDLGYAVRSKNSVHHHQHNNNNNSMMMMMMSVPPMLPAMHHHREHHHQSKLPPSAGKKKHSTQHGNSPSSAAHFKQQQQQHSGKQSKQSRGGKSKPFEEEEGEEEGELVAGATAALYDSLAAELRAKLGNPKMGPLLLPPRDYDGTNNNNNKGKENVAKRQSTTTMFPLTRSESSGKSSSGIGSEEALSSEINQTTKKLDFYGGRGDCYNDDHEQLDYHHHQQHSDQPQSFIDYDRHRGSRGSHQKRTSQNRYLFGGSKPEKSQPYSLPMNNAYSSEEEEEENSGDDDDEEGNFDHRRCDHHSLEVDAEDIEEDVLFTANCNRSKSKSTFDLFPQYKFAPENAVALHNSSNHGNGNNFANSFEVAEASKYHHQQQQQQQQQHRRRQQPSYPSFPLEMDHLQFAGERKSRSRHQHQHQQQQQQQQQHMAKMYASNPNLSRNPLKEVKQTSDKSAFVMGRREQRTLHTQQQHQLISGSSPPVGKFSFGAVPTAAVTAVNNGNSQHRQSAKQQQPQPQPSSKQPPKFYFADAEFGMDSKMALPFAPFPLGEEEDHFANRSKAKKCAGNLAPSSSRAHHQQLGRSSGNLVALDYSGPTSLANYHFHNGGSAEGGRRSPGHFRAPRQETRYEMPPQPTSSSSSSAAKIRGGSSGGGGGGAAQHQQYNGQPPLSAYSKSSRSSGNGFQQQQHQHPLGYDHELAMRKKLEQPYSRYSYIDVEHSRAERFHYVPPPPPAAMRR